MLRQHLPRARPIPYLTRAFFSLLAERMPAMIRVVLAHQAGRPVAMAFSLVGGDSLYGRYWGCLAEFDRLHFETCFYRAWTLPLALACNASTLAPRANTN